MYHSISLREKVNRSSTDIYIYSLSVNQKKEPFISHWHHETEIIYCKCSGTAYINDKSFEFKENDIIFVNKNHLHNINPHTSGYLYCFLFDYQYLDFKKSDWCSANIIAPLDKSLLLFPQIIQTSHKLHKAIEPLLCEILQLYNTNSPGKQIKIKALLYDLLYQTYSANSFIPESEYGAKSQIEYVRKIISYMTENISENITLDDICEKTFLSKGYIISIFKSATGQTPIVYLRNLRLEYASKLLKEGKSVTDAACLCGITNISYFIREYKEKYGTTPKKHYQGQEIFIGRSLR